MTTVTIAMPVFNPGRDLRLAVQSIVDQSFEDWELVLVDDGSADGAIAALGPLDPRIRVVADGSNRGLAARLNQIIDKANGLFIARMDHDDIAHPERLARQIAFLSSRPDIDLVGTRCMSMSADERIVGELPFSESHEEIARRPWLGFHLAHPSWMGRTEWFRRHRYAEPAPYCCEDQELLLRALTASRYHALHDPLMAYRVRSKVRFMKLLRTRVALLGVQIRHFSLERRFSSAALAAAAFGLRVAWDVARELAPGFRSDLRPADGKDAATWATLIAGLKLRAPLP